MRKLLIVLLSLIALLVVGWFGIYQMKAPDIQADIKQRVGDALSSNSLDWVSYDVDGRDVTLNGQAQTQQMADYALETADIYGLNSLSSNIAVAGAGQAAVDASGEASGNASGEDSGNTSGDGASQDTVADSVTTAADSATDPVDQAEKTDTAANADSTDGAATDAAANTDAQAAATVAESGQGDDSEAPSDVAVQEVGTDGVAALPITMNIAKDASGEYIFNGTVPNMELKQTIDEHLVSVGADPTKAVWQVELSSAQPPANWQQNILNSISTVQALKEGEINLSADQAIVKGTANSQDVSDAAEVFAQKISGEFETEMNIAIVSDSPVADAQKPAEDLPLVGSDKYAAKFCQTEFNAALKQQKIVFESGSATLQKSSAALLNKIAQVAGRCPTQGIEVRGYTDSQGAASANLKLSKVRAEAVVNYLQQQGIGQERLVAKGYGERNPVATNKTKAGRAQNRRIKLIVKGLK